MVTLTRRDLILLGLGLLYAAAVVPIGVNNGADLQSHLPHVDRMLHREPPYPEPAAVGLWWPPFALLTLTPIALIARISVPLAKGVFALVGVAALTWTLARYGHVKAAHLALAVTAVAVPLESNFEWLNWNTVILALVIAGALDLSRGRELRAGAWLGIATALKVFPALLLLFAAYRRHWRAAVVGSGVAVAVSLLPLLPLGITGAIASVHDWLTQSAAGSWVVVRRNQSLPALLGRAGWSHEWIVALDAVLVAVAAVVLRRSNARNDLLADLGIVLLVAVVISPIAWIHYYFLAFPAWIAVISRPAIARPTWVRIALIAAGISMSGLLTIWGYPSRVFLQMHSLFAWGALVLLGVLLVERSRKPMRLPSVT